MIDATLPSPPPAPPERDTWAEENYPNHVLGELSPEERTEGLARLAEASQLVGCIPDHLLMMVRSILNRPDGSSRFVLESLRTL